MRNDFASKYFRKRDRHKFILTQNGFARIRDITYVDLSQFEEHRVFLKVRGLPSYLMLTGIEALEFVWRVKPSALEGKNNVKWLKNAWVIHNLIGHPVMQLLAFCRLYSMAMWIHDVTIPRPVGFKAR